MLLRVLKIPRKIWRALHILGLKSSFGDRWILGEGSRIASPGRVNLIGDSSKVSIGRGVQIEEDTCLNILGQLSIGEESYISVRCLIGAEESVEIGRRVAIGPNVTIIDTNKNYANLNAPIISQGGKSKKIVIEDDTWIGANVVVLAGSQIGAHSVVAAGSVVRGVFPPRVLLAGCPAKIIRNLE
jgi:acetyltransferase-like isoleucine patch superfamily enzyme